MNPDLFDSAFPFSESDIHSIDVKTKHLLAPELMQNMMNIIDELSYNGEDQILDREKKINLLQHTFPNDPTIMYMVAHQMLLSTHESFLNGNTKDISKVEEVLQLVQRTKSYVVQFIFFLRLMISSSLGWKQNVRWKFLFSLTISLDGILWKMEILLMR